MKHHNGNAVRISDFFNIKGVPVADIEHMSAKRFHGGVEFSHAGVFSYGSIHDNHI